MQSFYEFRREQVLKSELTMLNQELGQLHSSNHLIDGACEPITFASILQNSNSQIRGVSAPENQLGGFQNMWL
jgi:hypothetical protein